MLGNSLSLQKFADTVGIVIRGNVMDEVGVANV